MDINKDFIIHQKEEYMPDALAYQPPEYSVYARADEKKRVTRIFSTCFEEPLLSDVLIKSGTGDEYVHTGYYNFFTPEGAHRYIIDGGAMRESTQEETEAELLPGKLLAEIDRLKHQLSDQSSDVGDWKITKCHEYFLVGLDMPYDVESLNIQRDAIRDRINELELELLKTGYGLEV